MAAVSLVPMVWFWRGLKGHSVTFAVLFASLVLGFSLMGVIHRVLADVGVHWLYVLLIPIFLVRWLSKREAVWIPDEARRRRIARSILAVSLVVAVVAAWVLKA